MGTGKFSEYVLAVRKKDGVALCHSSHYPPVELQATDETVDVALSYDEYRLLEAARTTKKALALVESIKWKIKYWGGVDAEGQ